VKKIKSSSDELWKYFILSSEVEPNLHGIYIQAKTNKVPYAKAVRAYLDDLEHQGFVPQDKKNIIYNAWKKAAKKVGGLPPL